MNVKNCKKGDREKSFENVQRNIHSQNLAKKPVVFHNISKPSPQLTDESEFPSLNELSGKTTCNSQSSGSNLKYSDKLKSHTAQNTTSNYFHFKHDAVPTNFHEGKNQTIPSPQVRNKWFHDADKSNEKSTFQVNRRSEAEKSNFVNKKAVNNYTSQNNPKSYSNHSFTESLSLKSDDKKNHPSVQKHATVNTSNSTSIKTNKSPHCASTSSKLNCQVQSRSDIKLVLDKTSIKDNNDASDNVATKKKKKRKSKVKRQVALQTGKITVLTPEVHSKILNQTSVLTSQNFKSVLTDINDEEEYPELGKSLIPTSQKENYPKKESNFPESSQDEYNVIKSTNTTVEKPSMTKDVAKESDPLSLMKSDDKSTLEKKVKSDKAIHPNDPITVSFFDILVNKNCKTKAKDFKAEIDPPLNLGLAKIKLKKNACHPHNLLDSSSPAVKRGKEREKPKPKKPSQLKKIILLDRKVRREHLLQLKGYNHEEGSKSEQEVDESECNEANNEEKFLLEDCCENSLTDLHSFEQGVCKENSLSVPCDNNDSDIILFDDDIEDLNDTNTLSISEICNYEESSNIIPLCTDFTTGKNSQSTEEITDLLDNTLKKERGESELVEITKDSSSDAEMHLNVSKSPDSSLNSLINEEKQPDLVDKEKAVKVLLHTRNFREYCNHLISVDIDDVVYALLDDLARFQDRLHQKDPVKARMKRRMIYGVKEVKKHIKLKKLKCIVVAADIENIETHGGLNDLLNDIKSSAADHHIPCIFALSRKVLGKVCRKPVPVSCVGVFNFEGSEANFKKMVELQTQSKVDYAEISSKLSQSITDEQIVSLLKAKKEAPETLRAIRTSILGDFFLETRTEVAESGKNIESAEKGSDFSDTET